MRNIKRVVAGYALILLSVIFVGGCASRNIEVVNVDGERTVIPKAEKNAYLELSEGGAFAITDKNHKDYEVSWQAKERIMRWSEKKGYYLSKKSAADANMSEELYQAVKKWAEKNNDYIENIKSQKAGVVK